MRRTGPSCHGGASSMLRLGPGATPLLADMHALSRFKVLQPSHAPTQLSLFQRPVQAMGLRTR